MECVHAGIKYIRVWVARQTHRAFLTQCWHTRAPRLLAQDFLCLAFDPWAVAAWADVVESVHVVAAIGRTCDCETPASGRIVDFALGGQRQASSVDCPCIDAEGTAAAAVGSCLIDWDVTLNLDYAVTPSSDQRSFPCLNRSPATNSSSSSSDELAQLLLQSDKIFYIKFNVF